MKKAIILSLVAVFVSFASITAQTAPATKAKAKTETKACCKEGDKKACSKDSKSCDKDAKACDKKAEGKACCKDAKAAPAKK
ncbi:MAG: hypothetical protein ACOYMD_11495 [Paludibacter sp.]